MSNSSGKEERPTRESLGMVKGERARSREGQFAMEHRGPVGKVSGERSCRGFMRQGQKAGERGTGGESFQSLVEIKATA